MKFKIIEQHDMRDCGATCLAMVSHYYGLKYPLQKYRELTKTDRIGTNLYGIIEGAKQIGFDAEALYGNINELLEGLRKCEIQVPFIVHTKDYHYIVITQLKSNKVEIADPGRGKYKISLKEFEHIWTGYIVNFKKTEKFKAGNFDKNLFSKFLSLLEGQRKLFISIFIFSMIIVGIGLLGTFMFETAINVIQYQNNTHVHNGAENLNLLEKCVEGFTHNQSYNNYIIFLIIAYIVQAVFNLLRGFLLALLSKQIDIKLMLQYYGRIIRVPISSINTRLTGEYLARFSEANEIRDAVSGATITLMIDTVIIIFGVVLLFLQSKELFFVAFITYLLYIFIVLIYKKPIREINFKIMESNAHVQSYYKESLDGFETIKANTSEKYIEEKITDKFKNFANYNFKGNLIHSSQNMFLMLIESIGYLLIVFIGFRLAEIGRIEVGTLITFYFLFSYFIAPLKNLIELQPMMQSAVVAVERLNDLLEMEQEKLVDKGEHFINGDIKFENINFRYGNKNLVLKEFNFTIKEGQKIGLIGESGSGKTTLVKLLLGFYKCESGNIFINKTNMKDINLESLRTQVAYIDQYTFLFSDSVLNNLILGNNTVTLEEVREICKKCGADQFIMQLPYQYNTVLDENGMNLSGGQRQRIAIARALLKKSNILILDEATSNLDTLTEDKIQDLLFNENNDKTCIIIAHRLSTVKKCDIIYVMEEGRIVESGTHYELLEKGGVYYKMHMKNR